MAYRTFDTPQMSRRALLRGGAWLTAGAALAGAPMGRLAVAREYGANWRNVTAMVDTYVTERKVANMIAALGWGRQVDNVGVLVDNHAASPGLHCSTSA